MTKGQPSKFVKKQKLSRRARIIAAVIFLVITAGAILLWASAKGYINLRLLVGVCGFKQRFGLPCPGCGWTHAGQVFFTGHILEAFRIQPAAGFFCVVGVLAAIFALHCALFGIDFGFLQYLSKSAGISILLISAIVVIMAGWAVTLIRSILENSGY
ncbi:MAG: DUF2752 domain-containing protein [Phycisphaerae bacterium]|nr:DUF2752 domain-containing protein [Phycisphaerae bacterium]